MTERIRANIDAIIADIARLQAVGPMSIADSKQAEDREAFETVLTIERGIKEGKTFARNPAVDA